MFLNKHGTPLNAGAFRVDYWSRLVPAANIRERKFYATRHTLITEMVGKGIDLKKIADYTGTSVAMIEQHYCPKQELDPDSQDQFANNQTIEIQGYREVIEKLSEKPLSLLASPTGFEPKLIKKANNAKR